MTPTAVERCVLDASAAVALLIEPDAVGRWVAGAIAASRLEAPDVMPWECANVIRRSEARGDLTARAAAQARSDLVTLAVASWPYDALGSRVTELRANLTTYDAGYVALAELLDCPLVTLDERLARAPGIRCRVLTPNV